MVPPNDIDRLQNYILIQYKYQQGSNIEVTLSYNCQVCLSSSFNDKLKTRYVRPGTASSSGVDDGVVGAGALLGPLLSVLLTVLLRCRGPLFSSVGLGLVLTAS